MAYYNPSFYQQQPYSYQDQLSQLRNANPIQNQMSMQGFQMPMNRPDPTGLNWVQGEAGAKSWFVSPGATVLLMDSEGMRFYLKSADMNGVPAMRTFEYTEVGVDKPAAATAVPETKKFVTVDEYEQFRTQVLGKLDELSAPVEVSLSRKKKGEANE